MDVMEWGKSMGKAQWAFLRFDVIETSKYNFKTFF